MFHQGRDKMAGRQAPRIPKLRRDNDIETPVGHGELALLPQAAERRSGGHSGGPQSSDRLFGTEAVSPPCDQIRYELHCGHRLPFQMNCSGKVTHFVTFVERYMLAIICLDDAPFKMPFSQLNGTYNGISAIRVLSPAAVAPGDVPSP
jgi:hypothetical protein